MKTLYDAIKSDIDEEVLGVRIDERVNQTSETRVVAPDENASLESRLEHYAKSMELCGAKRTAELLREALTKLKQQAWERLGGVPRSYDVAYFREASRARLSNPRCPASDETMFVEPDENSTLEYRLECHAKTLVFLEQPFGAALLREAQAALQNAGARIETMRHVAAVHEQRLLDMLKERDLALAEVKRLNEFIERANEELVGVVLDTEHQIECHADPLQERIWERIGPKL